ncbi:hypothetical protein CIK05_15460 [Bdellovibrio sp. qaytius]|nr:hypothetical protein CIK05_15460 [Bdellovibrio sp. qaytius]
MAKKSVKKTIVHTHPRRVKPSAKNHLRRLPGTYLDELEIYKISNGYNLKNIQHPSAQELDFEDDNTYNDLIAIWTDYFNNLFNINPKLDPDMIKALIGSESGFKIDPKNPLAIGISQITKETLKIVQDPDGEAKDFIFNNISQKDLKKPSLAIPIAVRWLAYKKARAESKLGRPATPEDIVLEYKGLLKSKSDFKKPALKKYRELYAKLKK